MSQSITLFIGMAVHQEPIAVVYVQANGCLGLRVHHRLVMIQV
jgi:hypothetical protein